MFVLGKHDPIFRVDGQQLRRLIRVKACRSRILGRVGPADAEAGKQALDLLNETRGYLEGLAEATDLYGKRSERPAFPLVAA